MGKIARLFQSDSLCQPGMVYCSSAGAGGVNFQQSTRLVRPHPFGRMTLTGGGTVSGEHRINRWISDSDHNFFGYDLLFDPTERRAVYRLAFEALSITPDQALSALPARLGIERAKL